MDGLIFHNPSFTIGPGPEEIKRRAAVRRLWTAFLKTVRVRHPDPRVNIELILGYMRDTGEPAILFSMSSLRDTGNPDRRILDGFLHFAKVGWAWPGEQAAGAYIAALWSLYMIHEALELTTFKEQNWPRRLDHMEKPVIDAHDVNGFHQKTLAYQTNDIPATIDWALGLGAGRKLVDENADRARQDVENEMNPWNPGT